MRTLLLTVIIVVILLFVAGLIYYFYFNKSKSFSSLQAAQLAEQNAATTLQTAQTTASALAIPTIADPKFSQLISQFKTANTNKDQTTLATITPQIYTIIKQDKGIISYIDKLRATLVPPMKAYIAVLESEMPLITNSTQKIQKEATIKLLISNVNDLIAFKSDGITFAGIIANYLK